MRGRIGRATFTWVFICAIIFAMGNQTSEAGLREDLGLVALWTLDQGTVNNNNVDDVSGQNDGAITGSPKSVPGHIGDALDFDGAVDLIRMTDDIIFPSITMEAIINPTLGTRSPIYDKYNYGIQLLDSDNVGIWIRADTEVGNQWPSAYIPFPTDGQWHHVVGVVDDQQSVRIYLDGELGVATDAPDSISVDYGASQKPTIGYSQHMGGIWYEGAIDEVAVYDRALSDADVQNLYGANFIGTAAASPAGKLATTWGMLKH